MLKKVLIGLGAIILLLLVVAFLLPAKVRVERSIVINASTAKVFKEVNSLNKWGAWDPWQKKDPNIHNNFTGPEAGVGCTNTWKSSHKEVGSGSQTITESVENTSIKSKLSFGEKGEMGGGTGSFDFSPEGEGTKVVWGMEMDLGMNPIARYMGLMMDGMMGGEFEAGLNNLKGLVESMPEEAPMAMETTPGDSIKTEAAAPTAH